MEEDGESFVTTCVASSLESALQAAISTLPFSTQNIKALAIAIVANKDNKLPISDFGAVSEFTSKLNPETSVKWGIFPVTSYESGVKVVLIGTANNLDA